ncbi:ArsR/SmtB family transcription factor [Methanoplanus endosymbiosus]|uniref:Helix-turn-helix domain-containing protein n=1 Tax=Methanoplanus endosymbiosus TaxID=33865 RepID=A0A9E7THH3_9EURY|nr:helix-turn-helix domain-containing protein [Methanoplanus endosymbiosus]UUX92892.1 helix-turn-helix domain-containing protein [Methanoplanus endosymbiosus]
MSEDLIILEPGDERAKKIGKAMASPVAGEIMGFLRSKDMTLSDITDNLGIPMTTAKYHVENLLDSGMVEIRRIKYSEKGREVKVYGASGQVVIMSAGNKDLRSILLKYASVFGLLILASLFVFGISGVIPGMISSDLNQGISPDTMVFGLSGYDESEAVSAASASDNYSGGGGGYSRSDVTEETALPEPAAKGALPPGLPEDGQRAEVQAYATASDNGNEVQVEVVADDTGDERSGEYSEYSAAVITGRSAGSGSAGVSDVWEDNYLPADMIHMMVLSFFFGGCLVLVVLMLYEAVIWRKEKSFWQEYNRNNKNYIPDNVENTSAGCDDRSSARNSEQKSETETETETESKTETEHTHES